MIKADFYIKKDGIISSFDVEGHAESGPYGHDLVCAAVSAVTTGAINAVLTLSNKSMLSSENQDGYMSMEVIPSNRHNDAQVILKTLKVSLETIEIAFPDNIKVNECEPEIKSYEKWENKNNDN